MSLTSERSVEDPKNVLWWLPEFPPNPGGISTFAGLTSRALRGKLADLTMFVGWDGPTDESVDGMRVIREPFRAALEQRNPAQVMRMKRRVSEVKTDVAPDVYHVHLCEPSPLLHLSTAATAPAPTVVTLHNEVLNRIDFADPDSLLHRLASVASTFINCSVGAHRANATAAPHWSHKMVPLPNGIDPGPPPSPMPSAPRILAVGKLVAQKGFERLIRSMPAVLAAVPDARLRILGDGSDRDALTALAASLGVAGQVELVGTVERDLVRTELDEARVVVAPSRHEGLPYALLEAAAAGRPIVASRIGGVDEAVADGVSGTLIDQALLDDDPTVLAGAIVDLLTSNDLADRYGRAARRHVEAHLSLDLCAERHLQVYRAVTRQSVDLVVLMPAWNAERHISAALDSILADLATTPDITWRLMVIDDGSTDRTADMVRSYAEQGVELFSQPNLGPGIARNSGLALTDSEFVAHFDSDDIWPSGRIAALLAPFRDEANRDAADDASHDGPLEAVFGAASEFIDDDAPTGRVAATNPVRTRMATAGIIRRSAHDRVGGFHLDAQNDQLAWATSALAGDLRYEQVDSVTWRRRIHASNRSHDRPFTEDVSRVAVIKRALDDRRARAAAASDS